MGEAGDYHGGCQEQGIHGRASSCMVNLLLGARPLVLLQIEDFASRKLPISTDMMNMQVRLPGKFVNFCDCLCHAHARWGSATNALALTIAGAEHALLHDGPAEAHGRQGASLFTQLLTSPCRLFAHCWLGSSAQDCIVGIQAFAGCMFGCDPRQPLTGLSCMGWAPQCTPTLGFPTHGPTENKISLLHIS